MKLTRQARRRLAREAAKPTVEFVPSLTKKPQRGESKHVRAGFTKNHGINPRRSGRGSNYAKRRQSFRRRFLTLFEGPIDSYEE